MEVNELSANTKSAEYNSCLVIIQNYHTLNFHFISGILIDRIFGIRLGAIIFAVLISVGKLTNIHIEIVIKLVNSKEIVGNSKN